MRSNLLGMCSVVAAVAVAGSAMATVQTYSTNFSDFNTGWFWQTGASSAGWGGSAQNGWTGNGTSGTTANAGAVNGHMIDGYVVDTGGGNNAFRLSNATTTGNYEATHASPAAIAAAGESSTGAANNRFAYSMSFKSASASVQQGLDLRPTAMGGHPTYGRSMRHGALIFTDDATTGFTLSFSDYVNGSFRSTVLASGLDRTAWHTVSVDMTFNNGLNNDTATVMLNGQAIAAVGPAFTTWEQYYQAVNWGAVSVDKMIFRASVLGPEALRGGGVLFDNLSMSSIPSPGAVALVGLAGMVGRRRKV